MNNKIALVYTSNLENRFNKTRSVLALFTFQDHSLKHSHFYLVDQAVSVFLENPLKNMLKYLSKRLI